MPTYEYECKSCGHTFDVFQRMSDAPLTTCPQCGQALRRLINGGSGVIFKGSGFYVTDKQGGGASTGGGGKPAQGEGTPPHGDTKTPAVPSEHAGESSKAAIKKPPIDSGLEKKIAG
ncbi:MAG: zinc ribbon domain-containing protein [Treponema sp.]|jgi:putative FmdB family regulatory protein|nr:zinc ribbon domain-containing protein [Treponema sp.]